MKKRINITLEDEVIRRIDHFAEEHYTSRSGAITMLIVEGTAPVRERNGEKHEGYDGLHSGEHSHSDRQ